MATPAADDPLVTKLNDILDVLRDLVILESAKAGLSLDEVRKLLGVRRDRVSRIWKHLKKVTPAGK